MSRANGYPGQVFTTSSISGYAPMHTPSYTCSCGNPATNINDSELFCSGCHFQYTVAKSSGRLDEWVAERRKKAEERAAAEREKYRLAQEKYYTEMQAQAQQSQQNWPAQANAYPGLQGEKEYGKSYKYEEAEEEKPASWWKSFATWRMKQK